MYEMYEREFVPTPERRLLPKKIRDGLNEIRQEQGAHHEKAARLAALLRKEEATEVDQLDCDVCVTDYDPTFYNRLSDIYPENLSDLPPEEQAPYQAQMEATIPTEAKTRVHAATSAGELTWCFGCESTMCMNEVVYPENPDWDKTHTEVARRILQLQPEWHIKKFQLIGSTRNRICINVISDDPNFEHHTFNLDGRHVIIIAVSPIFLKHNPDYRDRTTLLLFLHTHSLKYLLPNNE